MQALGAFELRGRGLAVVERELQCLHVAEGLVGEAQGQGDVDRVGEQPAVRWQFYDYRTDEPAPGTFPEYDVTSDVWDTGLWGDALWSVSIMNPFNEILGASGIGRAAAVAVNGQSYTRTDLVSLEIMWDTGGLL